MVVDLEPSRKVQEPVEWVKIDTGSRVDQKFVIFQEGKQIWRLQQEGSSQQSKIFYEADLLIAGFAISPEVCCLYYTHNPVAPVAGETWTLPNAWGVAPCWEADGIVANIPEAGFKVAH